MNRRRNPKAQRGNSSFNNGPSRRAEYVSQSGMSVFRPVKSGGIYDALLTFENEFTSCGAQPRSHGDQKSPAVNILQKREMIQNKALLRGVLTEEIINAIYTYVPSVRKKRAATPVSLDLFGAKTAPVRPVVLTFSPSDEQALLEERSQIISVVEDMAPDSDGFEWMVATKPHLSLGKIMPGLISQPINEMVSKLEASIPSQVTLKPATLYDPLRNS